MPSTAGRKDDSQLTATHLGGRVAARRADLLLLVEGGATAPPAGSVGLVMPLTERSRSLRLLASEVTCSWKRRTCVDETKSRGRGTRRQERIAGMAVFPRGVILIRMHLDRPFGQTRTPEACVRHSSSRPSMIRLEPLLPQSCTKPDNPQVSMAPHPRILQRAP